MSLYFTPGGSASHMNFKSHTFAIRHLDLIFLSHLLVSIFSFFVEFSNKILVPCEICLSFIL